MQRDLLHDANQFKPSYLNFYKKPLTLAVMLLSGLFAGNMSYAALSARTANTIQGTKPYLLLSDGVTKLTNLDELLGFSMWDGTYEADGVTKHMIQIDANMVGTAQSAPAEMTYNDVVALVVADGTSKNLSTAGVKVGDDDGDALLSGSGSVTGQMKATWKNGGVVVPASDLGQTLSSCGGPYTLTIEVPTAVNASTRYGDPNTRGYGTSTGVTYTFAVNGMAICYLKPDVTVFSSSYGPIKFALGYNSAVWDRIGINVSRRDKGFSVSKMSVAGVHFPTVGFEKARFNVIGSGNDQSKYRCSSPDDGGKITLSGSASSDLGAKCTVTYNSATKAAFTAGGTTPTITMEYNTDGSNWMAIGSYSIMTPSKWAIGAGQRFYGDRGSLSRSTSFPALDACRVVVDGNATPATTQAQALGMTASGKAWRQKYLYRRDELTNTPYADRTTYPELNARSYGNNFFSRDVDGTFMGEWGDLRNYAGSIWAARRYDRYWSAEAFSTDAQYLVFGGTGGAFYSDPINGYVVAVCRGE